MEKFIKLRMAGFAVAILGVCLVIGWAARASWQRFEEIIYRLTFMQLESFHIGDEFRASLLKLDYLLIGLAIHPTQAGWDQYSLESKKLDDWIDHQRPSPASVEESAILTQISDAYDVYQKAASQFHEGSGNMPSPKSLEDRFDEINRESGRLVELCDRLMSAHHVSMTRFLANSHQSIFFLRMVIFTALISLLVLGGVLVVVLYRETVLPLRLKLQESRQIIERQEKLSSLGVLAAGLAHEIRNPLTAIKARLFTQQKQLKPGTSENDDAQVIGQEINRLDQIVKGFLQFARPADPKRIVLPARQALEEVRTLMSAQLQKAGIHLEIEEVPPVFIKIDPIQIKQVMINLVQNAAESIGQNGTIVFRARRETMLLRDRQTCVVLLEVADTGKGISPEVEKRLFDPFFTTKEGGTGLGLSIAARIVEKHGGILQYHTRVNHGTVFDIVLPEVESHESPRENTPG